MQAIQLEPMGIGKILDTSFRLYRANFLRFLAIVAVIKVPLLLVTIAWQRMIITNSVSSNGEPNLALVLGSSLVTILILLIAQTLCTAALMKSVSGSYLGEDISVGGAYKAISPKIFTLIIAGLLVGLVVGAGFLLLVVPGIIFGLWFSLTSQVIVLEGGKATAAMGRSKKLVSGNLGKVFGLGFILVIIGMVVNGLFEYAGEAVGGAVSGTAESLEQVSSVVTTQVIVKQLFATVGEILFMPVSAAGYILLYYDLRIRKEGFDLEMLAQSLSPASTVAETQSGDQTQMPQ